jgi:hypothetical protein
MARKDKKLSKKQKLAAASWRRRMKRMDEAAGRRPEDARYLTALRSPLSNFDGSPPRGVDKSANMSLGGKRRHRKK